MHTNFTRHCGTSILSLYGSVAAGASTSNISHINLVPVRVTRSEEPGKSRNAEKAGLVVQKPDSFFSIGETANAVPMFYLLK